MCFVYVHLLHKMTRTTPFVRRQITVDYSTNLKWEEEYFNCQKCSSRLQMICTHRYDLQRWAHIDGLSRLVRVMDGMGQASQLRA